MTPDPRTALEAKARAFLEWLKQKPQAQHVTLIEVEELTRILLSTQADALEEAAKDIRLTADNLYCQSLDYCRSHCLGLQVIEKFTPEQQQEKLKELKHSEQLMGGHVHLARAASKLEQQAAQRRVG